MKTTSPADRLAAILILEAMRALAPDDPRTWALELGAWRVAAEAVVWSGEWSRWVDFHISDLSGAPACHNT